MLGVTDETHSLLVLHERPGLRDRGGLSQNPF
jgi:hypothetical protein